MAQQGGVSGGMKELSSQSLYGLAGNSFIRVFVFLASIVYTNFLGAELFGIYSGLISFFTLLYSIVLFAFDRSLILCLTQQWFAKDYGKFKGTLITSLFVMLGIFVVVTLVFLLFKDVFLEHYLVGSIENRYLLYGFLFLFFNVLITVSDTVVNSLKHIALITISKVIRKMATLGFFLVGFYTFDEGLDSLFIAQVFGLIIGVAFYLYRRKDTLTALRREKADYSANPEVLKYTLTMFLVGLSSAIVRDIDKIMLSTFLPDAREVAFFVVALRTGMLVSIFGASIAMIFRPRVAEAFGANDMERLEKDYHITTRWILFTSLPALITFFVFPEQVLSVFGAEFTKAHLILRLIVLGVLAEVVFGLNTVIMVLSGKRRLIIFISLIGVVVNITLNYILIPVYGAEGAALATILTYLIGRALTLIFVYREFGILPFRFKALLQVSAIVVIILALTYGLRWISIDHIHPLVIVAISGAINYLITFTLYLRFAIGDEETIMLKQVLPARMRNWIR